MRFDAASGIAMSAVGKENHPRAPAAVLAIFPGCGENLVIAKGQYSPDPRQSERFLVFSGHASLNKRADVWMTADGFSELRASLGERHVLSVGECDCMYATRPVLVWAEVQDELRLWKRGTLVGRFSEKEVRVRPSAFGKWIVLETGSLQACRGFLADDWFERGVVLVKKDDSRLVVARKRELSVLLDPTYSEWDLMADAAWVGSLAGAIGRKSRVEMQLDEGL